MIRKDSDRRQGNGSSSLLGTVPLDDDAEYQTAVPATAEPGRPGEPPRDVYNVTPAHPPGGLRGDLFPGFRLFPSQKIATGAPGIFPGQALEDLGPTIAIPDRQRSHRETLTAILFHP